MFNLRNTILAVYLLSTNLFSQVWTGGIAENSLGHIFVSAYYYPTRVLKSIDAGVTWTYSDSGFIEAEDPDFLAVDSKDYIFSAGVGSNVYRSTDGGIFWEYLRYLDSRALAISDNDYIYIGVDDSPPFYLARSTDSGNTWEDQTGSITKVIYAIESNGSYIYAGGSSGHFYISSNYGDTWNFLPLFTQNYITEIFVNDSGHIFTGTWGDGAFVSKDNGLTWQKIFNVSGCIASIQASDNEYLFVALGGYQSSQIKIFRSSDNGSTWNNTDNGLPTDAWLWKLFKASDNSLYMTTMNGYGIYKSTDYGDNWFHIGPITEITEEKILSPTKFSLSQNYPNPFNPSTKIKFTIPSVETTRRVVFTTLKVYDVLGNEIATLVNEELSSGEYEVEFSPESSIKNPASGIYFYTLRAGEFIQTKKMILIK